MFSERVHLADEPFDCAAAVRHTDMGCVILRASAGWGGAERAVKTLWPFITFLFQGGWDNAQHIISLLPYSNILCQAKTNNISDVNDINDNVNGKKKTPNRPLSAMG